MPSKDLKKYEFVRKDYRWQTKIICPICKKREITVHSGGKEGCDSCLK